MLLIEGSCCGRLLQCLCQTDQRNRWSREAAKCIYKHAMLYNLFIALCLVQFLRRFSLSKTSHFPKSAYIYSIVSARQMSFYYENREAMKNLQSNSVCWVLPPRLSHTHPNTFYTCLHIHIKACMLINTHIDTNT